MPESTSKEWWRVLKVVRATCDEDMQISTRDLAFEAKITPKVASMWLAKFYRWGYLKKSGEETCYRGRPAIIYTITEHGLNRSAPGLWKKDKTARPQRLAAVAANPPKKGKGKA